jgi:acetyltransferase-like isoleucine patch superfamily enzyme
MPLNNKIALGRSNNALIMDGALALRTRIRILGANNTIIVHKLSRLINTKINISGNNNRIEIFDKVYVENGDFCVEDDGGEITIGEQTIISGYTHIAAIEGTKITVGKNCLFSADITIRSGDSHSIIECNSRKRINPSKDVSLGNRIWLCNGATVLKGVEIPDNCIVSTHAVVTKSPGETNCIIGGNPAIILKRSVDWDPIRK